MPKKDTKAAVLAMLSEAGASRRLPSARDAAPAEPATDPEADHSAHTVEESLPSSSSADDRTESEQRSNSRVAEQQPAVGGKAETEAETETETVKDRAPSPGRSRRTEGRRTRPSVASADDTDHAGPRTSAQAVMSARRRSPFVATVRLLTAPGSKYGYGFPIGSPPLSRTSTGLT